MLIADCQFCAVLLFILVIWFVAFFGLFIARIKVETLVVPPNWLSFPPIEIAVSITKRRKILRQTSYTTTQREFGAEMCARTKLSQDSSAFAFHVGFLSVRLTMHLLQLCGHKTCRMLKQYCCENGLSPSQIGSRCVTLVSRQSHVTSQEILCCSVKKHRTGLTYSRNSAHGIRHEEQTRSAPTGILRPWGPPGGVPVVVGLTSNGEKHMNSSGKIAPWSSR